MENELQDNLTIIESFVNYCKNNNPDRSFVSKLANQIKLHYSEISDDSYLYNNEMKYDFSDIEFIDNNSDKSNSTDNESQNDLYNESQNDPYNQDEFNNSYNEENREEDTEDKEDKFNESTIKRLEKFLILDYDPKDVYLYNKNPNILKSIENFDNQSAFYY